MVDDYSMLHVAIQKLDEKIDANAEKQNTKIDGMLAVVSKIELLLEKVANTNERLITETESRKDADKRLHHRIDGIDSEIIKMQRNQNKDGCAVLRTLTAKYDSVVTESKLDRERTRGRLDKIEDVVKIINEKPIKRLDKAVMVSITTVVTIIVTYVAIKVGLK